MDDSLSSLLILLLIGALLTIAHAAVANTRQAVMKEQAEAGNASAKRILALIEARSMLTLTYTLSQTLLYFLLAFVATRGFVLPLIAQSGEAVGVLAVVVLAWLALALTQVAAEGIGSARPEPIAHLSAPALTVWMAVVSPFTSVLVGLSKLIASVFGGERYVNTVTEEEIMTLVNAGEIEEGEKDMIHSVLQLDERDARQLMVPRMDIVALNVTATMEQALDTVIGSGYSRIPVYEENMDNVVGLLYAKDMFTILRQDNWRGQSIRDFVRPPVFVPESLPADELLKTLQKQNVHMAIVVDEYGGTSGLVTIENLIEEIIGDIRDEFDQNEEAEYVQLGDDDYLIDATMNIADINDLFDLKMDDSEYDTLGGYVYAEMGHVPHVGEMLEHEDFTLKVHSIEGRRIRKVHFTLKKPTQTPAPEEIPTEAPQASEAKPATDEPTEGEAPAPS